MLNESTKSQILLIKSAYCFLRSLNIIHLTFQTKKKSWGGVNKPGNSQKQCVRGYNQPSCLAGTWYQTGGRYRQIDSVCEGTTSLPAWRSHGTRQEVGIDRQIDSVCVCEGTTSLPAWRSHGTRGRGRQLVCVSSNAGIVFFFYQYSFFYFYL